MTARRSCPPAPGPLESYAVQFDSLFHSLAQRHHFRTYLAGLLAPRDRPKTLTALAGAEPLVQTQAAPVQQLQFFLSEAAWDADTLATRTLQLLAADPLTAPSADGVLAIDDTGDRKDGGATDHVARQYLGSAGKIDNGIVAVTTVWAHEQRDYPLHVAPYTPARRLDGGKQDPAFHTKPQIALALIERAQAAGIPFAALVADCAYGDNPAFAHTLTERHLPCMCWRTAAPLDAAGRPPDVAHSFEDAARVAAARLAQDRTPLPRRPHRTLVGRRADPVRLWPRQDGACGLRHDRPPHAARVEHLVPDDQSAPTSGHLPSGVVRLYGLRNWIEQSYKQMKDELGWADFMVRSDRAIRRHWTLVCCAFAFCWWHEAAGARLQETGTPPPRKKNPVHAATDALLAAPAARSAGVADAAALAHALLARLRQPPRRPNWPRCLNTSGLAVASTCISVFNKLPLDNRPTTSPPFKGEREG